MTPKDEFTVVATQLLEMVEIAQVLCEHDTVNADYWQGFIDAICMLLGDLAGKRPVIIQEEMYMKFMDMRLENEIENLFEGGGD